jgi:LuxR family maltose regulon positive regulatory protein
LDASTEQLEEALLLARDLELAHCEIDASSLLAFTYAVRGGLKRAARLAHSATALSLDARPAWASSAHLVPAHVALAICAFEWGDTTGGDRCLAQARAAVDSQVDGLARFIAAAGYAWSVWHANPDADLQLRVSPVIRATVEAPPLLAPMLRVLHSRLELVDGNLDAAAAALEGASGAHGEAELRVARARLELARDDVDSAQALLAPVSDGRLRPTFGRVRVEALVLEALAAARLGDSQRAREWIERALETAEPDGMRGPFLDAVPGVVGPLRLAVRQGTAHRWLAASLLTVVDGESTSGRSLPHELLEPLSGREQVVLGYLPTLMSNPEIAAELFVSVNTVKTHLKSIYRKLGASHRREAVQRARELRLIG